jgi:ADP-ribosylglycohydrolase
LIEPSLFFFFFHAAAGAIVVTSAVAELCQSRDSDCRVDNHIGATITRDYARARARECNAREERKGKSQFEIRQTDADSLDSKLIRRQVS